MVLNVTIELFYDIFEGIAFFIGGYLTLILIRRGIHYRYFFYSLTTWILDCLGFVVWSFADLYLIPSLLGLAFALILLGEFSLLMQSDCLSHDAMDPIKIFAYAIMFTLFVVFASQPDAYFQKTLTNGDKTIYWSPLCGYTFFLPLFFSCVVYFYNLLK